MRKLYAGLDVSLEMTSIGVVDEDGGLMMEAKAVSEPEAIREVLVCTVFSRAFSRPAFATRRPRDR